MNILVIEDNEEIVEVISLGLQIGWPELKMLSTPLGKEGIELVENESPDRVILDLGLPDMDGFKVLKQIRLFSTVPIIILTVRNEEVDVVKGLGLGADDYMVKPFRQMELLARIKAMIRRLNLPDDELLFSHGPFRFSPSRHKLFCFGKEIALTNTEGLILHYLLRNAGKVVTHSSLAQVVWGEDYPGAASALKVYIRRLRQKIEVAPNNPQLILTKPRLGYTLVKQT